MSSAVLLVISRTDLRKIIKNMPQSQVSDIVVASAASRRHAAGFRAALCCLAVFLSLLRVFISNRGNATISVLPESYALCSRGSPTVYTADPRNATVQCLVVHKSRILDTGSLDEMLRRWSQKNCHAYSGEMAATSGSPLQVIQLPLGSIVIPGMSDLHGHALEYGSRRTLPTEGTEDGSAVVADGELKSDGAAPYGSASNLATNISRFREQRVTRGEVLRGMAMDPAYASLSEGELGSLEPRKLADYVVISRDIVTAAVNGVLDARVLAIVVDGQPVFGKV